MTHREGNMEGAVVTQFGVWCTIPTLFLEEHKKRAKPLDKWPVSGLILKDDNDQNRMHDAYPSDDDVRLRGLLRTE
jgi:hypothetical protein